jgi:DNA recombination protein RmuC
MELIIALLAVGFSAVIFLLVRNSKPATSVDEIQTLNEKINTLNIDNATLVEKLNSATANESELKYSIDQQRDELISLRAISSTDKSVIASLETKLNEQQVAIRDKLQLLEENEQKLKQEFSQLANEILEKSSKKLQEESEKGLGVLLNPMKIQLADFKKKVEDVYDKESKDRSALQQELKMLKDLNLKMSSDANNLTNALKGQNKQQGVWGEMVLETVLESSGLREGHEYKREVSLKDQDDTRFRPDVLVYLPHDRHIVIDAKTSLTAYNEYMSETDDELRQQHIRNHILSIKAHVKGLASKNYEDLTEINSLDFIFMFVPIEGALMLALEHDATLYDDTFKQKIILVSPTTLLVALRAVENSWRYEKQAQSIADVAKRAEALYGKFTGFVENLTKVGTHLSKADESYNEAFKQLSTGSGNLIMQVNDLKKVSNIKPKKELDKSLVEEALLE